MDGKKYDLVVVGTGDAGKIVAEVAARAGWRVAIVEKSKVGGTCAIWGCVPKKVLITGAELADFNSRMKAAGVADMPGSVSWSRLMKFKNQLTGAYPEEGERSLRESGIDLYFGAARFVGRDRIQAGDTLLEGRYIHIGSGARPRPLGIEGENHITDSGQFLYLEKLPQRILFVGGGFISFEYAHLAARCGSDVTIMSRGRRVLKGFDPVLAEKLVEASAAAGITFALEAEPKKIEKRNGSLAIIAETAAGKQEYAADLVVHGAGRIPDIEDMDLETGGVEYSPDGILVDSCLQSTSNSQVYAAGDAVAGGVPLTPVAMKEARVAAENLVHGAGTSRPDYSCVPHVVFALPRLASVGMQEEVAVKQGLDFRVNERDTSVWLHNQRVGEHCAGFRVLIENGTEKIIGAHILDSHADDLINVFALAMQNGLTAGQVRNAIYAYPTATSSIQYMLE